MKQYFVYMVRCSDDSFYVGVTSDLEKRIGEHNFGWDPESYTHERRPVNLVFAEDFIRVEDAIRFEKQLKGWSRAKKIALIKGDWSEIVRLSNHGEARQSSQPFDKLRVTGGAQDDRLVIRLGVAAGERELNERAYGCEATADHCARCHFQTEFFQTLF